MEALRADAEAQMEVATEKTHRPESGRRFQVRFQVRFQAPGQNLSRGAVEEELPKGWKKDQLLAGKVKLFRWIVPMEGALLAIRRLCTINTIGSSQT